MKLTRNFLIALFMLILTTASFAAPVVIRFWHCYDAGIAKQTIDQLVADFNKSHDGKIQVEALGISFWDYWDKLRISIAAGQEPDVFVNDLGDVGMRASSGILLDLAPYLKKAGIDANKTFFKSPLDMCRWKTGIYALPFETDIRLLFYNKDLFVKAGLDPNRPPKTWNELWQYADKITKKDSKGDYEVLGFNPMYAQSYFWMYVWGNGGDFLDKDGNLVVNSPIVVKSLTEWKQMVDRLGLEKIQKFNATYPLGLNDAFINKKLGMVIQNNTFFSQLRDYAPDLNYGVVQIPYPVKPVSWSNGFSIEASSRSRYKDAAAEFIIYLTNKSSAYLFAKNVTSLVGNKEAASSPDLMSNEMWKLSVQTLDISQFRPFVLEYPLWYEDLQKTVESVLYDKATPKKALDDLQKMLETQIQKYRLTH
ncbi:MAG: ABC transporter substrate-binding protein [Thermotogaceae bacterium]|nr:ABC transporter substrate-binding protein [Fervidobacterium sp.]NLH36836.1 ABC transporter substrate-binding protein [Thermotogaceae bacterium]